LFYVNVVIVGSVLNVPPFHTTNAFQTRTNGPTLLTAASLPQWPSFHLCQTYFRTPHRWSLVTHSWSGDKIDCTSFL